MYKIYLLILLFIIGCRYEEKISTLEKIANEYKSNYSFYSIESYLYSKNGSNDYYIKFGYFDVYTKRRKNIKVYSNEIEALCTSTNPFVLFLGQKFKAEYERRKNVKIDFDLLEY